MDTTYPGLSAEEMRKERKQLFVDAVRGGKKPKRVPILANTWTWMVVDSPYKLSEAIYDYDKMFDVVCRHHEKYEFDLYSCDGARNNLAFTDAFATDSCYIIDDEGYGINYPDSASIADAEDYPALLEKGLVKYYFENGIPRKYGLEDTRDILERFGRAIPAFLRHGEFAGRVRRQYNDVYGVPNWSPIFPEFPCDTLFKAIRGMRGFSIDLRRNTYYVEKALDMVDEYFYPRLLQSLDSFVDDDSVVYAGRATSLVHTVLNPRQFEKYQWPYIKRYAEELQKRDLIGTLYMEGNIEPLAEFFRDIPAGHLCLQIEDGDPVALKKKLPNITIAGGYKAYYLGRASKEECIDRAKELIDGMAGDGRYIFTTDKMLSFPGDAKAENFLALNSFLKEYAVF